MLLPSGSLQEPPGASGSLREPPGASRSLRDEGLKVGHHSAVLLGCPIFPYVLYGYFIDNFIDIHVSPHAAPHIWLSGTIILLEYIKIIYARIDLQTRIYS